ncbi:MAG: HAMP domain-containing histidine kinase [Clostridia bacterium]|nr:HAMP domain-containing histidine kinase [Clostridia bacterium]
MFNKTRRNIVFTVVFSLVALMAVTLTTIYLSNRIALERASREMLNTFAERYSPEQHQDGEIRPDGAPDLRPEDMDEPRGDRPEKDEREFRLSTFYSVAYTKDGEVLAATSGNKDLQSEDDIIEIASSILKKGKQSGRAGNMTYLVKDCDEYTLVAMIDGTINDNNQMMLFRRMLIIGSAALIILIVISVFIARRIVRPLEENDKKQKRFVSDAGHELKTPIAVISANSDLLKREIGQSEWLDNIDYENERMSDLVKQLLTLSKAENGEVPKETVDFSKLVNGEVLPFETLAYEKGKTIESNTDTGIFIDGNPGQLRQLVSILIDNALSHGTTDTIGLSLCGEKHHAVLTVSNGAHEMSADQLSHLFERFYRTDEARNDADAHYGLGLSIAKAVTEAHGGKIRAEYKNEKAVFTVILPIKKI